MHINKTDACVRFIRDGVEDEPPGILPRNIGCDIRNFNECDSSSKVGAQPDFEIQTGEVITMESRYELIIYWSEDDQRFIVEVPELPGCMADGATCQEAVNNTETIIAEWMETAKALGRTIPEPAGRLMYA